MTALGAADAIDPRFLDLALALIVVEAVALIAWRRLRGEGPRPAALIANLAAGAFLLIVARELLIGAGGLRVAVPLTLALIAHVCDLVARWERKPKAGKPSPVAPSVAGWTRGVDRGDA
jgi:hypothetical protein